MIVDAGVGGAKTGDTNSCITANALQLTGVHSVLFTPNHMTHKLRQFIPSMRIGKDSLSRNTCIYILTSCRI